VLFIVDHPIAYSGAVAPTEPIAPFILITYALIWGYSVLAKESSIPTAALMLLSLLASFAPALVALGGIAFEEGRTDVATWLAVCRTLVDHGRVVHEMDVDGGYPSRIGTIKLRFRGSAAQLHRDFRKRGPLHGRACAHDFIDRSTTASPHFHGEAEESDW
jgi:hypothetical protein